MTCYKASPISAAVYDIIINDATPTTQYTQTRGNFIIITPSSVHRIFERGWGGRKFEINEDQNENFPTQNQVRFSAQNPKLGEDQKKKKVFTQI